MQHSTQERKSSPRWVPNFPGLGPCVKISELPWNSRTRELGIPDADSFLHSGFYRLSSRVISVSHYCSHCPPSLTHYQFPTTSHTYIFVRPLGYSIFDSSDSVSCLISASSPVEYHRTITGNRKIILKVCNDNRKFGIKFFIDIPNPRNP